MGILNDPVLDDMLERAIAAAKAGWKPDQSVDSTWMVLERSGAKRIILAPFTGATEEEAEANKDLMTTMLRFMFRQQGVTHYLNVYESWCVDDPGIVNELISMGIPPSGSPDRYEALTYTLGSATRTICGEQRILRPECSPPKLMPFKMTMDSATTTHMEGRLHNMLEEPGPNNRPALLAAIHASKLVKEGHPLPHFLVI